MSNPAHADVRATTAQRTWLARLLTRNEYLSGPMARNERLGVQWRGIFKAAKQAEPAPGEWPTAGEWFDSLTTVQASAVINHLIAQES